MRIDLYETVDEVPGGVGLFWARQGDVSVVGIDSRLSADEVRLHFHNLAERYTEPR